MRQLRRRSGAASHADHPYIFPAALSSLHRRSGGAIMRECDLLGGWNSRLDDMLALGVCDLKLLSVNQRWMGRWRWSSERFLCTIPPLSTLSCIAKLRSGPSFISDALFAIRHRLVLLAQDSHNRHLPQVRKFLFKFFNFNFLLACALKLILRGDFMLNVVKY